MKINSSLGLAIAFLLMALTLGAAQAQPDAALATRIDEYLIGLETKGFSGVALITGPKGNVLYKAYGMADCKKKKLTTHMIFDLGSITKTFTAIAVLRLQVDGKLNLGDSISRYLDDVPDDKRPITIEQLLRHTSGLLDSLGEDEDYVSKQWLVNAALHSKLQSEPGVENHYSNVGYSLLAAIIERITGKSYEIYLQQGIFRPAGVRIGYSQPHWKKRELACGMKQGARWGNVTDYFTKEGPSWHLVGNGGMLSDAADLQRWFSQLLDNKLLPESATAIYLDHVTRPDHNGRKYIATSGANLIFSSLYLHWLDEGVSIVLLTSNSEWPKEKVSADIVREVAASLPQLPKR